MPKMIEETVANGQTAAEAPKPTKGKGKKKPVLPGREIGGVIYPEFKVVKRCLGAAGGPLTAKELKEMIGYETEGQYTERMMALVPGLTPEQAKFRDEDWEVMRLKNLKGEKVVCWRNFGNRPFDPTDAARITQDVLNRCWAGPLMDAKPEKLTYTGKDPYKMADGRVLNPGDEVELGPTINGESIVISRSGRMIQGQHRCIGGINAYDEWLDGPRSAFWRTKWSDEPVLESVVAYGVSDDLAVVQTLDNGKPRTEADSIYVGEIVQDMFAKEMKDPKTRLDNTEIKLVSKMLAKATDLLWRRTGVGSEQDASLSKRQTHSASMDFRDRHKRIMEATKEIYTISKDKILRTLKLSPGQCAAMLYLMAAKETDGNTYWLAKERSEKKIDFSLWDDALKFWQQLGGGSEKLQGVAEALAALVDEEGGGRSTEKIAIIANAWNLYLEGGPIKAKDLELKYGKNAAGVMVVLEWPDFGGIDVGQEPPDGEDDDEEIQETALEIKARKDAAKRDTSRQPEEVAKPAPIQYDKDGKPPLPTSRTAGKPQLTEEDKKRLEERRKKMVADQKAEDAAKKSSKLTQRTTKKPAGSLLETFGPPS